MPYFRSFERRRGLTIDIPRRILSNLWNIYRFLFETSSVVERSVSPPVTRETGVQFLAGERNVIFKAFKTNAHQFCHDDSIAQMGNKHGWNKEVSHKNVGWTLYGQYTEGHCIISWRTEIECRKSRLSCLQEYSNTSKQFRQDDFFQLAGKLTVEHIFSLSLKKQTKKKTLFHCDHYGVN